MSNTQNCDTLAYAVRLAEKYGAIKIITFNLEDSPFVHHFMNSDNLEVGYYTPSINIFFRFKQFREWSSTLLNDVRYTVKEL